MKRINEKWKNDFITWKQFCIRENNHFEVASVYNEFGMSDSNLRIAIDRLLLKQKFFACIFSTVNCNQRNIHYSEYFAMDKDGFYKAIEFLKKYGDIAVTKYLNT